MTPTRYGHRHSLGITRREFLQVGYSGLLGIGLHGLAGRPCPCGLELTRRRGALTGPGRSR